MKQEIINKCKTKNCDNNVIKGKYCQYCTQTRKDKRKKTIKAIEQVGKVAVLAAPVVIKKAPKFIGKNIFKI